MLEADPSARILYIVSSRALAWSSTSSFNSKWTTYMFDGDLKPRFRCYMSEPGPLSRHQLVVCSIQSCWRTSVNRKPYSLVIIDEIASCLEDACSTTVKQQRSCFEQLRWCMDTSDSVLMMDAHVTDLQLSWACISLDNSVTLVVNEYLGPRRLLRKTDPPPMGSAT